MEQVRTRVAVVGGGIAGLTAAFRLQQAGTDYRLIESAAVAGGKIRTERVGGFTIEAGPDSFLAEKPAARELCEEIGLGEEIIPTNDARRRTFLVSRGRLRPLPEGFVMLAPVDPLALLRSRLVSLRGVARMAVEPLVPVRTDPADESVGAFIRRRLGGEVLERIVDPLLSGIYAGESDRLSIRSTFPRLAEMERTHGSLVRGLLAAKRKAKPKGAVFLSLRGGMDRLATTLAAKLDARSLLLGTRVATIAREETAWRLTLSNGSSVVAERVIFATPAFVTASVVDAVDRELAELLRRIPYVSTASVALAYRRADVRHPLDGFGFVVPRIERRRITACTWVSTKLPERAPADGALLRCFIGRAGEEEHLAGSDDDLQRLAREELRDLMGIDAEPLFARVFRWGKSMPQYLVGHQELLAAIDARLAGLPGVFVTGSAYRGVGLPDCIREAGAVTSRASVSF
ncbi:MAG: protoporphyrinogen oxidase [Thermoanaerobaculia bacterium]